MNRVVSEIIVYITDFSKTAQKYTSDLSLSGFGYGWLIIFFFIFVIIITALSLGRTRIIMALLSLYIASFFQSNFIWIDQLKKIEFFQNKPDFWLDIGIFLISYIIAFGILNASVIKSRLSTTEASLASIMAVSIFEIGFLASIILNYFPPESLERVPQNIKLLFATKTALFSWAALSVFLLMALRSSKKQT